MIIYALSSNGKTILLLLGIIAFIALSALGIFKALKRSGKSEAPVKPSDEEIMKEEMNRILCPIEDEEISKKVSEYKDED